MGAVANGAKVKALIYRCAVMSGRLQNQIAWVSGAASGMGEAIARLFAQEGAAVALVDLQAENGQAIAEQIRAEGGQALFIKCDVRSENQIRKDNTIDYADVLNAMRASEYNGYLGIEYVWIDWEHCNESDNLSETILFRDYLRAQMRS